jgi:hypothetical protein
MAEYDLHQLRVRFETGTVADQGKAARELARSLSSIIGADGSVEIVRSDEARQDIGTVIVLVLGTPAAVAVAKGIHDYISKRGNRVVIETSQGSIVATGDAAKNIDIAKTAAAINKRQ